MSFQSLSGDELCFLDYVDGKTPLQFLRHYSAIPDFHPPGFLLVLNLIGQYLPLNEITLRLPSALAGTLTGLLTYLVGKELFTKEAGLLASSFWAVSGASVYFSQEARSFSMLAFFCLLVFYLCQKVRGSSAANKKKTGIALFLAILACFYTHYLGFFFSSLCLMLYALRTILHREKRQLLPLAYPYFSALLLFAPWLTTMIRQAPLWTISKAYNKNPNLFVYGERMLRQAFGYETYWRIPTRILDPALAGSAALLLVLLIFLWGLARFRHLDPRGHFGSFIFPLCLIPLVVCFLVDSAGRNRFFYERNFFFLLPFFYLAVSQLLCTIPAKGRYPLFSALCALMIFQPFVNQNYFHSVFKTDYKHLAAVIPPSAEVFVACGYPRFFELYLRRRTKAVSQITATAGKKTGERWILGTLENCSPAKTLQENPGFQISFSSHTAVWGLRQSL